MNWLAPTLTLALLLLSLLLAYRQGHRNGFKTGFVNGYGDGLEDDAAREKHLEILDTYQSGRVFWRYGTGETTLIGFCHKNAFPGEALDTVASYYNLAEQTRHQQAADALIDDFLATHGPFRNME